MPVPTFDKAMLPILKLASDKKEHSLKEAIEYVENYFKLTEEECAEMLPSGR